MQYTLSDHILDKVAAKFRMLGDPTRLAILRALMTEEKNVSAVGAETGQGQANVSKHLRMLAKAGMVRRRKVGLQVYYRVSDPRIEKLCSNVCGAILDEARAQVVRNCKMIENWRSL
jgi:DNA-binding transcriptional ArsR family regulator